MNSLDRLVDVRGVLSEAYVAIDLDQVSLRKDVLVARDSVENLIDKADNALRVLANAISAGQIAPEYIGVFNDLNAAINRAGGV